MSLERLKIREGLALLRVAGCSEARLTSQAECADESHPVDCRERARGPFLHVPADHVAVLLVLPRSAAVRWLPDAVERVRMVDGEVVPGWPTDIHGREARK